MVTCPCSSNCRTCCTIRICTSSTSDSRIGPWNSISSVRKVLTRSDEGLGDAESDPGAAAGDQTELTCETEGFFLVFAHGFYTQ